MPLVKRVFDLALLALTAVLWVPLLLLLAGVVRLGMGRPVLFRQTRANAWGARSSCSSSAP